MATPLAPRALVRSALAAVAAAGVLVTGLQAAPTRRIIAVGDIHGDASTFAAILARAGILDAQQNWIGGDTVLVQTGDYLDRGRQVKEIMDLLMRIEKQAEQAGGKAVILAGNHEIMNAIGDLRYVAPEAFEAFVDGKSQERRQKAWREYERLAEARRQKLTLTGRSLPVPEIYQPSTQEAWMAAHPPGWLEYRRAFGPDGEYGKWIRKRRFVEKVGDNVFVHGGLDPDYYPELTIDAINERARDELRAWDRLTTVMVRLGVALPFFTYDELMEAGFSELQLLLAETKDVTQRIGKRHGGNDPAGQERFELAGLVKVREYSILSERGPLWFRGFASWTPEIGAPLVDRLQKELRASRFVVGHTQPKDLQIASRFDGRVFLIDTQLSSAYEHSRPSLLEITDGQVVAITDEGRKVLVGGAMSAVQ
ncbi:MAG TPA: metallophosphoesterase [Vicinamibacterales bacterium]|nr:metallophosphoesterase [Vicinamibacterales bacterium]